jgi:hypothetical protein
VRGLVEDLTNGRQKVDVHDAGFMRSVRGLVEDLTNGRQKPYHESNLREGF